MQLRNELDGAQAHAAWMGERIQTEVEFAEELCRLHPEQSAEWRPRVAQAQAAAQGALAGGELGKLADATAQVEDLLAPLAATAKQYTVHCVGHAHIDMNWMWSWPETVSVTVDTFGTVLRLMEEFPAFCFSQSQASTYRIIQEYRPDLLEQIAAQVRAGRWEVTASHWVEGDKNLASSESLCRHLLYTRQFVQELFGLKPEDVRIDWAPDTFGHAATVPTYLVQGGVRYVYMHRPGGEGMRRPWLFWWQGPDGARVLVRNDSNAAQGYNGQIGGATVLRDWRLFTRETGLRDHLFVYGVGDHGGGPTRCDLNRIIEMDRWPIFPAMRFARAQDYMDRAAAAGDKLPVLARELNFEFAGCYTTQTLIKRANRFGENRLTDAEAAAALAAATIGSPYPRAALLQGWRGTLFSHFHDILPGSGVRDTRTYAHGLFQKTMATTGQIEAQALRALAAQVHTASPVACAGAARPAALQVDATGAGVGFGSAEGALTAADQSGGGARPFLVFNPTAADRTEIVKVTVWATRLHGRPLRERAFAVHTADGKCAPAQTIGGGHYWGHEYVELAFPVRVPGLGYAVYTVVEQEPNGLPLAARAWQLGREHHCPYSRRERSPEGLENDLVRLELDPVSGGILSLVDKQSGSELVDAAAGSWPLELVVERPHGMTAWLIDHADGAAEHPRVRGLRRSARGPYVAAIEADLSIGESEFTLTYAVHAGDPRVHVALRGTWFQRGTPQTGVPALSWRLPLALAGASGRYEIPFGAIDREQRRHEEVPALRWAQVHGTAAGRPAGCLVANDCKYGHSLDGSVLRVTLIRSSYDPDILPEIGQHEARFTVRAYAGELAVERAIADGQALNHPLRVVGTGVHEGRLPQVGQFVRLAAGRVVLDALKWAEAGQALIVRLHNPSPEGARACLELEPSLLGEVRDAAVTDLLERPAAGEEVRRAGNRVETLVPARGIRTLRLDLGA